MSFHDEITSEHALSVRQEWPFLIPNRVSLGPMVWKVQEGKDKSDPPPISYISFPRVCRKVVLNKYFLKRIEVQA